MVNVEFEQEQYTYENRHPGHTDRLGLVERVIKISGGKIKTERQATILIFIILVVFSLIAFVFFKNSNTRIERGGPGPSPSELEQYRRIQPF